MDENNKDDSEKVISQDISNDQTQESLASPPPELPDNKSSRNKKLFVLIFFILILIAAGTIAAFFYQKKNDSLINKIENQEQLSNLSEEERAVFCREILTYDAESQEVKELHERLGMDGGLYENLWLGCSLSASGDEYVEKDKSGENYEYYRRNADKSAALAKTVDFDLYDTTYDPPDLDLSKRLTTQANEKEAKSQLFAFSTLADGGFDPYSSEEAISIRVFYVPDFADLTTNCGPTLMVISYADQYNKEKCEATDKTFMGNTIYRGGYSDDEFSVTVEDTRIVVSSRSDKESYEVINSMKRVTLNDLDFFIKN